MGREVSLDDQLPEGRSSRLVVAVIAPDAHAALKRSERVWTLSSLLASKASDSASKHTSSTDLAAVSEIDTPVSTKLRRESPSVRQ